MPFVDMNISNSFSFDAIFPNGMGMVPFPYGRRKKNCKDKHFSNITYDDDILQSVGNWAKST